MLDESAPVIEFETESDKERSRLIDACIAYFEVSIGHRKLTKSESDEACQIMSSHVVEEGELPPVEIVKTQILPIDVDKPLLIRQQYQTEYLLFDYLAEEMDVIDGPFLPMLRYEISMQRELRDDERYDIGIIRQFAFLESFFRMKKGQWKDSNGRYLEWEDCVGFAHEDGLISDDELEKLDGLLFSPVRNAYAHDWRQWGMRFHVPEEDVESAFSGGLEIICALYGRELKRVYEGYSGNHISESYPTRWEKRDKCRPVGGDLRVRVEKTCTACGWTFRPREDDWRYCPECGASHDWLETIGSKFK